MRTRCQEDKDTILKFVKMIHCKSAVTMVTRLNTVTKTTEGMSACKPRFSFIVTFRTDFGNRTAKFDVAHWQCREVILDRETDWVHKMRLETRDNNNHVMECLILVEKQVLQKQGVFG